MTDFVLAGTGSRSLRTADRATQLDAMELAMARIAERVLEHGNRLVVMSGGAEGWDECVARAAIRLRVRLWLALPNRGYIGWYWGRASLLKRDRLVEFAEIEAAAWKITHVMEEVHGTSALKKNGKHANFWRNDFMVIGGPLGEVDFPGADDFAVLGPVVPGSGTAHCVKAIKDAGKWRDGMVISPAEVTA